MNLIKSLLALAPFFLLLSSIPTTLGGPDLSVSLQPTPESTHSEGNSGQRFDADPLDSGVPSLFKPAKLAMPPQTKMYSSPMIPYETNRWWINFVVGYGDDLSAVNPYLVKAMNTTCNLCLPSQQANKTSQKSIWANDWIIGDQGSEIQSRIISSSDDLSVTIDWLDSKKQVKMRSPLVRGMPFATYEFNSIAPNLTTVHDIKAISQSPRPL